MSMSLKMSKLKVFLLDTQFNEDQVEAILESVNKLICEDARFNKNTREFFDWLNGSQQTIARIKNQYKEKMRPFSEGYLWDRSISAIRWYLAMIQDFCRDIWGMKIDYSIRYPYNLKMSEIEAIIYLDGILYSKDSPLQQNPASIDESILYKKTSLSHEYDYEKAGKSLSSFCLIVGLLISRTRTPCNEKINDKGKIHKVSMRYYDHYGMMTIEILDNYYLVHLDWNKTSYLQKNLPSYEKNTFSVKQSDLVNGTYKIEKSEEL